MNKIPKQLHGKYDFVWSNCALGHLGSIENGLRFIIESARCLKPGGYAVHTTEMNTLSNTHTVDNNKETVIFRPRDMHELALSLYEQGYELSHVQLTLGHTKKDQQISISPEFGNGFSKLQVGGHIITQVVIIIRKLPKARPLKTRTYRLREQVQYRKNILQQKKFASQNSLLQTVKDYEKHPLSSNSIRAVKQKYAVKLDRTKGAKDIYLEFKNTTKYPIFGMHDRLHTTKPIALGTAEPEDRNSSFKSENWFNNQGNRPSIHLSVKDSRDKWVKADYIRPGARFAYRLTLAPSSVKPGDYIEHFAVLQEGNRYLADSAVEIKVRVV